MLIGTTLVLLGLLLLFLPLIYKSFFTYFYEIPTPEVEEVDIVETFADFTDKNEPIRAGEELLRGSFEEDLSPDRIVLPSVSIDLSVKPAKVVGGKWEVFEDSAAFGVGSAVPGRVGNTVIFAHARENAFLALKEVSIGDNVYLLVGDAVYKYAVYDIREVLPNDVSVLADSESEILTLYTCSGFQDMKRLIVVAKRF